MTTYSKKVCLLGELAVGKTSLVRRFVYDLFEDAYLSTIGVKVSRKSVAISRPGGPVAMTMLLWDISSNEEFAQVRNSYLRGTAGAALVCDLSRLETISRLYFYASELRAISAGARIVIAANKTDLPYDQQAATAANQVASALGAPIILTSARTGADIDTLFLRLAELMLS